MVGMWTHKYGIKVSKHTHHPPLTHTPTIHPIPAFNTHHRRPTDPSPAQVTSLTNEVYIYKVFADGTLVRTLLPIPILSTSASIPRTPHPPTHSKSSLAR